jgi:hypothetical protein
LEWREIDPVNPDIPRRRLLGRTAQGAGALLVAGALVLSISAGSVAAPQSPGGDCVRSQDANPLSEEGSGSDARGRAGEADAPCDRRESCEPRSGPGEDGQPRDDATDSAGGEEKPAVADDEGSDPEALDPATGDASEDEGEDQAGASPDADDPCRDGDERGGGDASDPDWTAGSDDEGSVPKGAAPGVTTAAAASKPRSDRPETASAAQRGDDDRSEPQQSMSAGRKSGAGQYEEEEAPEAGSGSGSDEGKGSGSGGAFANGDGDLPDTGLAIGALVLAGLILFSFGALARRRLSGRDD